MVSFIYLVKMRPYEVDFLNTMEILNETANMIAMYILISLTEVIDSRDTETTAARKSMAGNIFIAFLLGLIAVHIVSLVFEQVK